MSTEKNHELFRAIESRDIERVRQAIISGADVEATDTDSKKPIHIATEIGSIEIMRELVRAGANLSSKDASGITPMHIAAERGYTEIIKRIVNKLGPESMNIRDSMLETPLHKASKSGKVEASKTLITLRCNKDIKNREGLKAVQLSVLHNHLDVLRVFIESDRQNLYARDSSRNSLLHLASITDNIEILKYISRNGLDINERNANNKTAVELAFYNRRIGSLMYLLEKGANIPSSFTISSEIEASESHVLEHMIAMVKLSRVCDYLVGNKEFQQKYVEYFKNLSDSDIDFISTRIYNIFKKEGGSVEKLKTIYDRLKMLNVDFEKESKILEKASTYIESASISAEKVTKFDKYLSGNIISFLDDYSIRDMASAAGVGLYRHMKEIEESREYKRKIARSLASDNLPRSETSSPVDPSDLSSDYLASRGDSHSRDSSLASSRTSPTIDSDNDSDRSLSTAGAGEGGGSASLLHAVDRDDSANTLSSNRRDTYRSRSPGLR